MRRQLGEVGDQRLRDRFGAVPVRQRHDMRDALVPIDQRLHRRRSGPEHEIAFQIPSLAASLGDWAAVFDRHHVPDQPRPWGRFIPFGRRARSNAQLSASTARYLSRPPLRAISREIVDGDRPRRSAIVRALAPAGEIFVLCLSEMARPALARSRSNTSASTEEPPDLHRVCSQDTADLS